MKYLTTVLLLIFFMQQIFAQKKVVPVTQSSVTAVTLPAGTKKDRRMLMELAAKELLQMEAKKAGTSVNSIEILYLPANFTADSLTQMLSVAGWAANISQNDKDYYWMQKDNRWVVAYFSNKKNQTELYFGETGNSNNTTQQPTNNDVYTVNQNTQQQQQTNTQQTQEQQTEQNTVTTQQVNTPPVQDGFKFNTTNFDDGWTSVIKEDWVEVTKGDTKVLLHYPKEGTIFPADPEPLTNAAWNILVAPRYSNVINYKTTYISEYNRPYLGMASATETATGKNVFVLLFRKGEGWIEFVMSDKNSFIEQFKFDPETIRWDSNSDLMNPLARMKAYNKFAVAASDIANTGRWSDHFASNTYYTNIYTGNSAGMSTYSSSQWFDFGADNSYKWQLVATNSFGGSTNFAQAKGEGTFQSLNDWQLSFSDIEGKPKTYDVYFVATKGGRVLFMNDAKYPGSGVFTGFSKN